MEEQIQLLTPVLQNVVMVLSKVQRLVMTTIKSQVMDAHQIV